MPLNDYVSARGEETTGCETEMEKGLGVTHLRPLDTVGRRASTASS